MLLYIQQIHQLLGRVKIFTFNRNRQPSDPMSRIYSIIRDLAQSFNIEVSNVDLPIQLSIDVIRDSVHSAGFSESQLQSCLSMFDRASVWSLSENGQRLVILN